jgi:hypothetical protein
MAFEVRVQPVGVVVARAILDAHFRADLVKDPKKAVADAGITISDEDLDRIMRLNPPEWGSLTLNGLDARLAEEKATDSQSIIFWGPRT